MSRLPGDFVGSLTSVHPKELFELFKDGRWPKGGSRFTLVNEIRPADLFCYLGGRFGPPNGVQNFLRNDDSDNLIHWDWTLRFGSGLLSFLGMNFRTEVHFHGGYMETDEADKAELVRQIKADFGSYGKQMGVVRSSLEDWTEFVNPYQRLKRAIDRLVEELTALDLEPEKERVDALWEEEGDGIRKEVWESTAARFSKGIGLCFGIRSMLPVLAEAYVNLVLFVLMRPEIRNDQRLRDNVLRQPIDVRIKSLSINCIGFERHPDYSVDACKRYHSLVNERNDLLHGNVVVDKLRFNEVYFLGRIPIFKEYRTMWQRLFGVQMEAVGLTSVAGEIEIVKQLVNYINSCLRKDVRKDIEAIAERYELAINKSTNRLERRSVRIVSNCV